MSKDIKTYEEMNANICGLLRLNGDQVSLYAAQRIKELEDENQSLRDRIGKAIEIPCEVGDKVYSISEKDIIEWTIQSINILISNINKSWYIRCSHNIPYKSTYFADKSYGELWFTDRAKAEARLAELGGKHD